MSKVEEFMKKWDNAKDLAEKGDLDDENLYDLCSAVAAMTDEEYENVELYPDFSDEEDVDAE